MNIFTNVKQLKADNALLTRQLQHIRDEYDKLETKYKELLHFVKTKLYEPSQRNLTEVQEQLTPKSGKGIKKKRKTKRRK